MIHIERKQDCCGCSACIEICPKKCISFNEDEEGFLYPLVDLSTCIDCKLCERVCPIINQKESTTPIKVFACKNKDDETRKLSSSGGVFSLLAEKVINNKGVVFGASFDDKWQVKHVYAETMEQLSALRMSKYVQSRMEDNFYKVKAFLKEGRQVLFVGTPCQIAGLNNYLKRKYDNLLMIDVICHGVPSPMVWKNYLNIIKYNRDFTQKKDSSSSMSTESQIIALSFRDKRLGWKKFSFSVVLRDDQKQTISLSHVLFEDTYMRSFLGDLNLRPSCYQCCAKNGKSNSDITLADYWGIENKYPDFDDDNGVSLMIVHTKKGFKELDLSKLSTIEVSLNDGVENNRSYYESVAEPHNRGSFFKRFKSNKESFDDIVNDLLRPSLKQRVKDKIKSYINIMHLL